MSRTLTHRGFTLVEILTVTVVLAVLAAILFPVLSRAREKGRQSTCLTNQRQIAAAVLLYAQDHDEQLPTATAVWGELGLNPKTLLCPTQGGAGHNSYGFNNALAGKALGDLTSASPAAAPAALRGARAVAQPTLPSPATCLLTADCRLRVNNLVTGRADVALRHRGVALGSYLDGHVALAELSGLPEGSEAVEEEAASAANDASPAPAPAPTPSADTVPPTISVSGPLVAERTSSAGTPVTLPAPAVSDAVDTNPTLSHNAPALFPLGTTVVTWTARDQAGNTATATQQVTIRDTTPPAIQSMTTNPGALWPPNHRMVGVQVTVTATDTAATPPTSRIVAVSSNEPVDGTGSGDTGPDWQITGALTVNLRAERCGGGSGRTYTITIESTDPCGNSTAQTIGVSVSHDQGN